MIPRQEDCVHQFNKRGAMRCRSIKNQSCCSEKYKKITKIVEKENHSGPENSKQIIQKSFTIYRLSWLALRLCQTRGRDKLQRPWKEWDFIDAGRGSIIGVLKKSSDSGTGRRLNIDLGRRHMVAKEVGPLPQPQTTTKIHYFFIIKSQSSPILWFTQTQVQGYLRT